MLCLWCTLDTKLAYEKQSLYAAWFAGPRRLRLPEHQPTSCLGQFACLLRQSGACHPASVAATLPQYDELSAAIIPDAPRWPAICLALGGYFIGGSARTGWHRRPACHGWRPADLNGIKQPVALDRVSKSVSSKPIIAPPR